MICTIISLIDRVETRAITVDELRRFDIEPHIILSNPKEFDKEFGSAAGNSAASKEALNLALEKKTDLLFCEDDLQIRDDFLLFLNQAKKADIVTYFYAHEKGRRIERFYPKDIVGKVRNQSPLRRQLVRVQDTLWMHFTQCVYIPYSCLRLLDVSTLGQGPPAFDTWLYNALREIGYKPLIAVPNPVQHRCIRVQRDPNKEQKPKESLSFYCEAF